MSSTSTKRTKDGPTPAKMQWWRFKKAAMDTVLFFRQGKFYECFHMDADVVVRELGLVYMKGEEAHAGFPELSYGLYSEKLVAKGYRVARVEQVETPDQLKERNEAAPKGQKDEVVARELCGVKTRGTRTCGTLDMESRAGGEGVLDRAMEGGGGPAPLFAIREVPVALGRGGGSGAPLLPGDDAGALVRMAAAWVDCTTGEVTLAEWVDDRNRSRLRTLLSRAPPAEILFERDRHASAVAAAAAVAAAGGGVAPPLPPQGLSSLTKRFISADTPGVPKMACIPGHQQFWSAAGTAEELEMTAYMSPGARAAAGAPQLVHASALSGLAASKKQAQALRLRDYFAPKKEEGGGEGVGGGASGASAASPGDAVVPVPCPDGVTRLFPVVLAETIARARADGFQTPAVWGGVGGSPDADGDEDLVGREGALPAEKSASLAAATDVPPSSLALSCFGALVFHLRSCMIDHAVLTLGKVSTYAHGDAGRGPAPRGVAAEAEDDGIDAAGIDAAAAAAGVAAADAASDSSVAAALGRCGPAVPRCVLDAAALLNLEVVVNSEGGSKGSLLSALDKTVTPAGRRRFREWVTSPLYRPGDVEARLCVVEDLMGPGAADAVASARRELAGTPDLERLLSRIHAQGSRVVAEAHPDSRAIFYEGETYAKRKIGDLMAALKAFTSLAKARESLAKAADAGGLPSSAGQRLLEGWPNLSPVLAAFRSSFDEAEARRNSRIKPLAGSDPAHDSAVADIASATSALADELEAAKAEMKCRDLTFWGSGKDRFQIEVPERLSARVPDDWALKSSKKGTNRYRTPGVEEALADLEDAESRREGALVDALRATFARFDAARGVWQAAVSSAATFDCLASLAEWSSKGDGTGPMARPSLVGLGPSGSATPFLHLSSARHPCLITTGLGGGGVGGFIPNDVTLGVDTRTGAGGPGCVLLTGPNMGGKSTWMRMGAVCGLLAQVGAYVPGEGCSLTPIDRVFTRVGASDRLLAGQSTFYVELAETSTILACATPSSLVLLDELGRGTSTFDGAAIAYAVTRHLLEANKCRVTFATHYHTLTDELGGDPRVALGHMGAIVEGTDVTFLYRYAPGACPKSYGLNVARLAGMPGPLVDRAGVKAEEFSSAVTAAEAGEAAGGDGSTAQLLALYEAARASAAGGAVAAGMVERAVQALVA